MSPELLTLLAIPLALCGGGALAQLSGPLACRWPAGGEAMLLRLKAVRTYRRIGIARAGAGAMLLAAVLSAGSLAAYAAAPASPTRTAAASAAPAVPGAAPVAALSPPGMARATPIPVMATAEPPLQAPPAAQPTPAAPQITPYRFTTASRLAFSVFADEGNAEQVRSEMVQMQTAQQRAATPASPTRLGPSSVYVPAGASATAVIALAFANPGGTWEVSDPDAQGGRTAVRVSTTPHELDPRMRPASVHVVTIFGIAPRPAGEPPAANAAEASSPAPAELSQRQRNQEAVDLVVAQNNYVRASALVDQAKALMARANTSDFRQALQGPGGEQWARAVYQIAGELNADVATYERMKAIVAKGPPAPASASLSSAPS